MQVSRKQSEIGIGQVFFNIDRFRVVEYLPHMYMYEIIWMGKNPEEIISYETIIHPFDYYVWAFIFGFTTLAFITLIIMQKIWAYASGQADPSDFLYQGLIFDKK